MRDDTLIQRLEALAGRVQAIDIRLFEGGSAAEVFTGAVPALRDALDAAIALLGEARRMYPDAPATAPAGDSENSGVFALQIDEAMRQDDTRERIVDVVVLGQLELGGKRAALAALRPGADAWALIDATASARRRLIKVLSALIQAICSYHGLPAACVWYRSELEISLAVRREYTRFRRTVARLPEPGVADVRGRLREAGTLLAMLIGKDTYEYARTSDRRQIRGVQERVLAWLRARDASPRLGIRVWQDFAALAGILVQINLRGELCEHDLALAQELLGRFAGDPSAAIGQDGLDAAQRLLGRDDELDAMLDAAADCPRWPFIDVLQRIVAALGGAPSSGMDQGHGCLF